MNEDLISVRTATELRDILGPVSERARTKSRSMLHAIDRQWLAASPFCLMSTSGADGSCDVSPKGDPPGFTLGKPLGSDLEQRLSFQSSESKN